MAGNNNNDNANNNRNLQEEYEAREAANLAGQGRVDPNVPVSNEDMIRLRQLTKNQLDDSTLRFAITQGKTDQLVQVFRNLCSTAHLRTTDNDQIDPESIEDMLVCCEQTTRNTYVIPTIGWRRTQFIQCNKTVIYGNCCGCYRAYPIGFQCEVCPGYFAIPRSSKIYVIRDESKYLRRSM